MKTVKHIIDGETFSATAATWPAAIKQLQIIIGARNAKNHKDDHAVTGGSRNASDASQTTAAK